MNLLVLSDLQGVDYGEWTHFLNIDQSLFDVVILLGDIDQIMLSILTERFRNKTLIGVLGNHDFYGDLEYYGVDDIHGKCIHINDISIAGLEGSVKYKKEEAPMFTQEEAFEICKELPQAAILISHNSPKGLHDKQDLAHEGFYGLEFYIKEKKPKFAFHGHQHINKISNLYETIVISVYGGIIFNTESRQISQVLHVID